MLHQLLDGIVTLLILCVLGLLLSIKQWPEWLWRLRSANWPTTFGTVESGEVSTTRDGNLEIATANLGYSYHLDGTYYSGYHTETFSDEQKARSYVDALRGKAVRVSYNPRKPEASVMPRQQLISYFRLDPR